jgi:hypothetical protein
MLTFLGPRANPRKLRLFAVACCRTLWGLVGKPESRAAVAVAENYADGLAGDEALAAARAAARVVATDTGSWAAVRAAEPSAWQAAREVSRRTVRCYDGGSWQARLMRDLFGVAPFRPVEFDGRWRTPAVLAVARAVYEERRFEDVPVLADALEEAGCADVGVLSHLRGLGQHARGCWLLDALFEKR